jgi:hypothetical protein
MIVVLDTNIWLEELALNSAAGSALRFYLKHRKARLALPEVVSLEVQHHLRTTIQGAIDAVEKGNRQLLTLFGSVKEIVLPTPEEVDALVSYMFASLGVDMLHVPFSLEAARASLMKTVGKIAPSDKTQEFKDGVLWADCLRLLEVDEILLATKDKAFFANREYAKGLAPNLLAEAEGKSHVLHITNSLQAVLDQVAIPVSVDDAWFMKVVTERAHAAAEGLLAQNGFAASGDPRVEKELFATENPDVLYFKYRITSPCEDVSGAGRTGVLLLLDGDGSLRLEGPELVDLRTGGETISFKNPDGTAQKLRNVYLSGNIALGHRTIRHSVRHPLGR